jgi:hypothetical protein
MTVQEYGQVFLWGMFKIWAIITQTLSETLNNIVTLFLVWVGTSNNCNGVRFESVN